MSQILPTFCKKHLRFVSNSKKVNKNSPILLVTILVRTKVFLKNHGINRLFFFKKNKKRCIRLDASYDFIAYCFFIPFKTRLTTTPTMAAKLNPEMDTVSDTGIPIVNPK